MGLDIKIIKLAQSLLTEAGHSIGDIDGLIGVNTLKALNKTKGIGRSWSNAQKVIGLIQVHGAEKSLYDGKIDGLWGPKTQSAYDAILHIRLFGHKEENWRTEEVVNPVNPNDWPMQRLNDLNSYFGTAKPEGTNLVSITFPYEMVIAWNPVKKVTKTQCNGKVKDSLVRVLTKVKTVYGVGEIDRLRLNFFGGCFNYRPMRGGTMLSTHSWGIALDFDPINNQLKWDRSRATLARPEYMKWWEIWEEEGWVSLGRQRNYDWMHVQACKLVS